MSITIYFSEISEIESIDTDRFIQLVSVEKQKKLKQYHFAIDRKLSLYAELLVRQQAICLLGLNNKEIEFDKNKFGKPFLSGYPSFCFNISHTRNAIAVAFSNEEVGVDIERVKSPLLQISKRFFTQHEHEYIIFHKNPELAFYEIWTKKEAYIKYTGMGLSIPLNSFNVLDNEKSKSMYINEMSDYIISVYCEMDLIEKPTFTALTDHELHNSFVKMI